MKPRAAHPADAEAISSLACEVFAQTYGSHLPPQTLQTYLEGPLSAQAMRQTLASSAKVFVIENPDLAGFVWLEATPTPAGIRAGALEVVKLYVAAPQQGQGVAHALMNAATQWSQTEGYPALWLVVWRHNPRAVRFYQRLGFVDKGTQQVWVEEVVFEDLLLEKELG